MDGQHEAANSLANGTSPQSRGQLISPKKQAALEHMAIAMTNPVEILKEQSQNKKKK